LKSLDDLRDQRDTVLAVLAATTAASTFLHLVRDILDDRPRSEKIETALRAELGALSTSNRPAEVVDILRKRVGFRLPQYALRDVPSTPTIRRFVLEKMGGQFSPGADSALHSVNTTI
jgi:hypothetical protein